MPTIKDVARAAGVSVATVSAVANGTKFVSEQLARRVRHAIDATGYQPHGVARSLKNGTTQTLGLIVTDITNPFFTAVARSVEDAAHLAGHAVVLCNSDEDVEKERLYLQLMRRRRVDALIWAPAGDIASYKDFRDSQRAPTILLDRQIAGLPMDAVVVDNVRASREAIEHLISLGHRRIALITGLPHLSTSRERLQGYREAMAAHALKPSPWLVVQGNFRSQNAHDAALGLLRMDPRPTAVFASNNLMAIGLLRAIRELGLRCPEDISVAAFDDFEEACLFTPGLTTIAQPTTAIGAKAVEIALKRIGQRNDGHLPEIAKMQAVLHLRGSCGPPGGRPPQAGKRN
jgi:LacI family transcriptional regulator